MPCCFDERADTDTRCIATVGYAAPEQYGLAQTDVRSDIFSLGVTLYELKTGQTYHMDARCGGALGRIVSKCTAFDPNRRYKSADALMRALAALTPRERHITGLRWLTAVLALCLVLASAQTLR